MTDRTHPDSGRIITSSDVIADLQDRIAELESELEAVGAGGVQALSAAPAGWKLVPVNPTPEMWKAAKSVPDPNPPYPPHYGLAWDAMLAASPTPTAEQQAAPKAAPGEPSDYQILAITTAYEQGVGKGHQAYNSGKEIANPYDSAYGCDLAWQYGYGEGKEQAQRATKAAPQQEAQEPTEVPYQKLTNEIDLILSDTDTELSIGAKRALLWMRTWVSVPLYLEAPQPAPAPLSEREAFEAAWEKLHGKRPVLWSRLFAEHKMETPAHSEGNYFAATEQAAWKLWQARAALAAQGGK